MQYVSDCVLSVGTVVVVHPVLALVAAHPMSAVSQCNYNGNIKHHDANM